MTARPIRPKSPLGSTCAGKLAAMPAKRALKLANVMVNEGLGSTEEKEKELSGLIALCVSRKIQAYRHQSLTYTGSDMIADLLGVCVVGIEYLCCMCFEAVTLDRGKTNDLCLMHRKRREMRMERK